MQNLQISIALCTYNGEAYLYDQLDSIAKQTHMPTELIIIDDNSTDNTINILNTFKKTAPFRVFIEQNTMNIGFVKNFEKTIKKCSGDIIFLSDQDDLWVPQKIEIFLKSFNRSNKILLVFSDADIVDAKLNPIGDTLWKKNQLTSKRQKTINTGKALEVFLQKEIVTGATLAFRSNYFDLIFPIPESWVHDAWIALLLSAVGLVECIPQQLIFYRVHGKNTLGIDESSKLEQLKEIINGSSGEISQLVNKYEIALERITKYGPIDNGTKNMFVQKIMHLKHRAAISDRMMLRIKRIFIELLHNKYYKYSNGWRTVIVDLLK